MYNPLVLSLEQIKLYTHCPKQYSFYSSTGHRVTKPSPDDLVIREIVKQCYVNRAQHGYDPQWETIKTRINKHCFGPIDIKDKEAFDQAYRLSIRITGILHHWYFKVFCEDFRSGLVNIPLKVQVSNSFIQASIDLVLLDNKYKIIPIIFDCYGIDFNKPYNDISFKTLLWLLSKEINTTVTRSEHATVTNSSIQFTTIFNKTTVDTMEKYVTFIVKGIENKVYFPSVGSQCDQCPFNKICSI